MQLRTIKNFKQNGKRMISSSIQINLTRYINENRTEMYGSFVLKKYWMMKFRWQEDSQSQQQLKSWMQIPGKENGITKSLSLQRECLTVRTVR